MTEPQWYDGVEPVTVAVRLDGATTHHVTWAAGELRLDDHPDVEADLALGALGGGRCKCVDVLEMWRAQVDAPEVLTVGRRWREHLAVDAAAVVRVERAARRWKANWHATDDAYRAAGDNAALARLRPRAEVAERRLAQRVAFVWLLGLDERLHDRLQLSVLAAAERRWDDATFRSRHHDRLTAALAGRAAPALHEGGFAIPRRALTLRPPGEPAVIGGDHAALPLSWLTNVWSRGVAVVEGTFVVAVTGVSEGGKVLDLRGVDGHDWRISRA